MSRGRPATNDERLTKWTLEDTDYDGEKVIIKYDERKTSKGPYSIERVQPKGTKKPEFKVQKRAYNNMPVFMVFKTSNRSNAKIKIKKFNQSIDYILTKDKLPGVPKNAEILDLGVGKSFKDLFTERYNLNKK